MPIYEYVCRGCGHQFEYLIMHSSPPPECPSCHKKDLEKQISLAGIGSENISQANLQSARKKSAVIQKDKQHEEHKHYHEHHD